jgi:hypothetical protein
MIDVSGVTGNFLHYGLTIATVGSAFLIFFYLWKKKRLGFDEEAKYKMMRDDDHYR